MSEDAMAVALKAQSDVSKHEAVCEQRQKDLMRRFDDFDKRLDTLSKTALGVIVTIALWAVVQLMQHTSQPAQAAPASFMKVIK